MIEQKPVAPKMVAVKRLKPAEWNPRLITDERFQALCRSIQADPDFMNRRPILAQKDGTIYAGNMRYRACVELGWRTVPALIEDVSDIVAKQRAVRDNNQWGEWQPDDLGALLGDINLPIADASILGFDPGDLATLLEGVGSGEFDDDPDTGISDGSLLSLLDITIADPRHTLERGQIWKLGQHVLYCGDVFIDWPTWSKLLVDGVVFVPYAGPFVALSSRADRTPLVIVQPDRYIAGHILDYYEQVHGDGSVHLESVT